MTLDIFERPAPDDLSDLERQNSRLFQKLSVFYQKFRALSMRRSLYSVLNFTVNHWCNLTVRVLNVQQLTYCLFYSAWKKIYWMSCSGFLYAVRSSSSSSSCFLYPNISYSHIAQLLGQTISLVISASFTKVPQVTHSKCGYFFNYFINKTIEEDESFKSPLNQVCKPQHFWWHLAHQTICFLKTVFHIIKEYFSSRVNKLFVYFIIQFQAPSSLFTDKNTLPRPIALHFRPI